MSPINIPTKPPPRVNTANGVNCGDGSDCDREREREKERESDTRMRHRGKVDRRCKRKRERDDEGERSCEKFNPLPQGYYSDNLLHLPSMSGPFMHSRGMPRRQGSHGKARRVATRRL